MSRGAARPSDTFAAVTTTASKRPSVQDVPLAALDLLAAVVAALLAPDLGGRDRLAVGRRRGRLRVAPGGLTGLPPQGVEQAVPGAVLAPAGEVVERGAL